jgi:hypothetical protein
MWNKQNPMPRDWMIDHSDILVSHHRIDIRSRGTVMISDQGDDADVVLLKYRKHSSPEAHYGQMDDCVVVVLIPAQYDGVYILLLSYLKHKAHKGGTVRQLVRFRVDITNVQ